MSKALSKKELAEAGRKKVRLKRSSMEAAC
jgi:hypothetical protein